jgi:hypothetical protein
VRVSPIGRDGAAAVKLGAAPGEYAAPAGFFADPPPAVTDDPTLSRQIPPGCAADPKLPRPATQLEEPEPLVVAPLVVPSSPLAAPGMAFAAPKLPRPADQPEAWVLSGAAFVAGDPEAAPEGGAVALPLGRLPEVCACAAAGQAESDAAKSAIKKTHLCFALLTLSILSRPRFRRQAPRPR